MLIHVHRSVTREVVQDCKVQALETLEKILKIEAKPLFTQNINFLVAETNKWKNHYVGRRHPHQYHSETVEYDEELKLMAT